MSDEVKVTMPVAGARHWVFTLQDDGEFKEEFKEVRANPAVRYMIYQKERGASGNYHYQGYIELTRPFRLAGMKKLFPSGAHFEPRRGSREQAREYCMKSETAVPGSVPQESGSFILECGKRNDLKDLYDAVKTGEDFSEIQERHLEAYAKYYKFADRARQNLKRKQLANRPFQQPVIQTYWGATGTNKTRTVHELEPDIYVVDCGTSQTLWWDGYDGQEAILFDDFYGGVKHHLLLKLIDGYRMPLQVKGAYTYKAWSRIYFTSNRHPKDWYQDQRGWPALERRLTTGGSQIIKMGPDDYEYDLPHVHYSADVDQLQQLNKFDYFFVCSSGGFNQPKKRNQSGNIFNVHLCISRGYNQATIRLYNHVNGSSFEAKGSIHINVTSLMFHVLPS